MKELLRKCPRHGIPKWQLFEVFHDGLMDTHRQMVDASCGGIFMAKNEEEAYWLLEEVSRNSLNYASSSTCDRSDRGVKKGLYELKICEEKILSAEVNEPSRKMEKLEGFSGKLEAFLEQKKPMNQSSAPNSS